MAIHKQVSESQRVAFKSLANEEKRAKRSCAIQDPDTSPRVVLLMEAFLRRPVRLAWHFFSLCTNSRHSSCTHAKAPKRHWVWLRVAASSQNLCM